MNLRHTITITALLTAALLPLHTAAQRTAKVKEVTGESIVELTENDSRRFLDAKLEAIETAKVNAIAEKFGRYVVEDFVTTTISKNGNESTRSELRGLSSVKGIWLSDLEPPKVSIEATNNKILFKAEVHGKAREIIRANTKINCKILKPYNDSKIETTNFNNGENIFLSFKSPLTGYLAVYLITNDDEVSCLLPSRNDDNRFSVIKNHDYTLFDKSSDYKAVQYRLKTQKELEYNQLVVIFSTVPFDKCADIGKDPRHPNVLANKDFSDWLLNSQVKDSEMVVLRKWLAIENKEQ